MGQESSNLVAWVWCTRQTEILILCETIDAQADRCQKANRISMKHRDQEKLRTREENFSYKFK